MLSEIFTGAGIDIAGLLPWSRPKNARARHGEYLVRDAVPNGHFWDLWQEHKESLKKGGISVKKNDRHWLVQWWQPVLLNPVQAPENDPVRAHAESGVFMSRSPRPTRSRCASDAYKDPTTPHISLRHFDPAP